MATAFDLRDTGETPEGENTDADLLAFALELADQHDPEVDCYFIGAEDGPVKIGYTTKLKSRLQSIQNGYPYKLRVLALARGGMFRERYYHRLFWERRLHGEWFERCPEIEAEIERLSAQPL